MLSLSIEEVAFWGCLHFYALRYRVAVSLVAFWVVSGRWERDRWNNVLCLLSCSTFQQPLTPVKISTDAVMWVQGKMPPMQARDLFFRTVQLSLYPLLCGESGKSRRRVPFGDTNTGCVVANFRAPPWTSAPLSGSSPLIGPTAGRVQKTVRARAPCRALRATK